MKITLTKVYRSNKDKNGNLLKNKDGKEYTRLSVKCKEYGDKYLSGFDAQWNGNWQIGDTVETDIQENGDFLNLVKPDPLTNLEKRIKDLEDAVFNQKTYVEMKKPTEAELKDLPF